MSQPKRNIVFLYTEIAPYFLACCKKLAESKNVNIHVVRYPVNTEAPLEFKEETNDLVLYNRKNYSDEQLKALVQNLTPSLIVCSGWIDKLYLEICRMYFKKVPTVLTMDTQWRGDLKQHVATFLSPFYLLKRFSYAWVPGEAQKKYALKLGFKESQIRKGFYSADADHFSSLYNLFVEKKKKNFPKRLIYTGRYYDFKGISNLWEAFIELQQENPNEWELWCLGTGTLKPIDHPKIKHFGFVQPKDFGQYAENTGVFVMPSLFEPWGVVLHEFALMGFPLLVSDRVGAAEIFLSDKVNGFLFEAENPTSLKEKLKTIMQLSSEDLTLMGDESRKRSLAITPNLWADTVMNFI